jgi:hypothetical protein
MGDLTTFYVRFQTTKGMATNVYSEPIPFPVWLSGQGMCISSCKECLEVGPDENCSKEPCTMLAFINAKNEKHVWIQVGTYFPDYKTAVGMCEIGWARPIKKIDDTPVDRLGITKDFAKKWAPMFDDLI